jgi:hypothetical protein
MMWPQCSNQRRKQELDEHVQGSDEEGSGEPKKIGGEHPFVVYGQYGGKQIPS